MLSPSNKLPITLAVRQAIIIYHLPGKYRAPTTETIPAIPHTIRLIRSANSGISNIRKVAHRDTMAKALQRLCANDLEFMVPEGGFYFWCKLKQAGTSQRLLQEAAKNRISFVPGEAFYTVPTLDKEFRLCFTTYKEAVLLEGAQRLAKTITQMTEKNNENNNDSPPSCSVWPII